MIMITACAVEVESSSTDPATTGTPPPIASVEDAGAQGTIRGTDVMLAHAVFDDQLELFEGESWASSPSLVIFLFLGDEESPAGRTFTVDPEEGMGASTPHVHYRWRDAETGAISSEAVMHGYTMSLTFGAREDDRIPGQIQLSIPGKDTRVEGSFSAVIE